MPSYRSLSSLIALALWQQAYPIYAAEACEQPAGRFASIEGAVEVQGAEGQGWQAAKLDHRLCEGDTIRVGEHSRAAVYLVNEAVLRIDQNTTMRLLDLSEKPEERSLLEIIKGAFNSMSRQPRRLTVNTPYLNGMIEGTEFLVRVEDDRATLSVLEGKVLASNAAGSLKVAPGESATAQAGQAPQLRTLVRPRDAVHWALYYPPVLTFRQDEFPPGPGWQGMVRRSTDFYSRGELGKALDSIATVPGTVSDPRFFAYRASLMLAVGRVDEANADIG
ncbi:MAG: FecR family protein, partial [Gammaproteobacteria bacterium]